MRACCAVPLSLVSGARTTPHTWVDVELRVIGQHVAVNIKNPNRSWVHNLGPQQKSTFLPWAGVLKRWTGSHSGCHAGSPGQNQDIGAPRTIWGGSSPGRCCGTGVCGISSVCYPEPGAVFAVQPCCPDWSQNGANVDFSLQESNGA